MKTHFLLLFVVSLILAVPAANCEPPLPSKKSLKVGAVLALTGYAAIHGNNIRQGLELAKADLEFQGWKVDLAIEDDNTQSSKTLNALYSLNARGYNLFIGPTWSFQVESAVPIVEKQNLLSYCPATSSVVVGQKSKNIFHGISFGEIQLTALVEWLKSLPINKIAIVYADCVWGQVHNNLFQRAAKEAGKEIVAIEKFSYGEEESVLPVLMTKLKTKGAEIILTTGSAQSSAIIVKKVKDLKMNTKVMSTDDMQDAVLQGLINVKDQSNPKIFALLAQTQEAFQKKYQQFFKTSAGVYADSAYDGLMVLAKAVENTDGSVEQVREYLHHQLNYDGYSGRFVFDENGDTKKTVFAVEALN